MLKIFHTGDIHLGMKFSSYPEGVKEELIEARYLSLEKMIEKSNDLNCDIFVIAGDLFNALKIIKSDIDKTIKILERFNGKNILILPGNHDYDNGIVDLWRVFENYHSEKIILLNENKEYVIDGFEKDIIIYPAPCYNKHSKENNLDWIKNKKLEVSNDIYRIGIAHGAIEGLSADLEGNYYPMKIQELEDINVDIWLLGHTHVRYPYTDTIRNNKIFNAGTHEPDGLNYKDSGSAWYVELSDEIIAQRITTGRYKFEDIYISIKSDEDILNLKSLINKNDLENIIIRLNLEGRVSKKLYSELSMIYEELEKKASSLIIDDTRLAQRVDMEVVENEFIKESFPYKFLENLSEDEDALQIAYELIRRE